jgi:hypothetical protein
MIIYIIIIRSEYIREIGMAAIFFINKYFIPACSALITYNSAFISCR